MAQRGETVTYTFSGDKETEDISNIDEITIDRMDGADGGDDNGTGGSGGLIEGATVGVSNYDVLEIWVGEKGGSGYTAGEGGFGRFDGGDDFNSDVGGPGGGGGGGSTELVAKDTSTGETVFIAAADAGGGGDDIIQSVAPVR